MSTFKTFEEVRTEEQKIIEKSRDQNARKGVPAYEYYVGLAFSGGGIRSATFNLGVLKH